MNYSGQLYGVVLNDSQELDKLSDAFTDKPYLTAPSAPVVYLKPNCVLAQRAVLIPQGQEIVASSTLALLFARDATRCTPENAMDHVGAMCVALDTALPQKDYYRPAIPQAIRRSSLALGEWAPQTTVDAISIQSGGTSIHTWKLRRLHRSPAHLISELSQFMTLRAGDVLLVGLPGDAPAIAGKQALTISAPNLPVLDLLIAEENA